MRAFRAMLPHVHKERAGESRGSAIRPDVVREIVIETEGRAYRDRAAEQRAALVTQ